MSIFTPPDVDGHDFLKLTTAREIQQGWDERRQALGQVATAPWAVGDDATLFSRWREIQEWLESNATAFVDHTSPIAGASAVPMFTLETWRAAAGLDSAGFRRLRQWDGGPSPAFLHGFIETSPPADIFQWWIYDDLQRGLDALRWTSLATTQTAAAERAAAASDSVCASARAAALSAWASAPWTTPAPFAPYHVSAASAFDGFFYSFLMLRTRSTPTVSGVPDFAAAAADLYLLANAVPPSGTFQDLDNLGASQDKLFLWDSQAATTGTSRTAPEIGNIGTAPITLSPAVTCPAGNVDQGLDSPSGAWVLKWVFDWTL